MRERGSLSPESLCSTSAIVPYLPYAVTGVQALRKGQNNIRAVKYRTCREWEDHLKPEAAGLQETNWKCVTQSCARWSVKCSTADETVFPCLLALPASPVPVSQYVLIHLLVYCSR
jgi:hypothetical protein